MNGSNKAARDVFNFEEIGSQVGQEGSGGLKMPRLSASRHIGSKIASWSRGIKVCASVLAGYVCLPEPSSSSTKEAPTPKCGLQ